jgi:murein L,D-transpeptidase YafK
MMSRMPGRFVVAGLALGLLGACGDPDFHASNARHWVPLTPELLALMQDKGMDKNDPVLIRTYKQEAEFEVWKKAKDGRYALLKTFPMCRWSGQLGPKRKEGDRQAPEGYYAITPAQLNPNSHYHLSYDIGYPNAYDRAHGGTGAYLMVHGDCSSAGCYSMTDLQIEEIYALVREAQSGGQKAVQMEAFPFRFTAQNMARHRLDPNMAFWKNLKEGADRFEVARVEPKVGVCQGRYTFDRVSGAGAADAAGCGGDADPELSKLVAQKESDDTAKVAELIGKGTPAVRFAYDDGGQHPSFKNKITDTSRPDSIAMGPTIELQDSKGAITKSAVRALGFDEASIASAITEIGSPATSATTVAGGAAVDAKMQASTSASAGAPVAVAAATAPGKVNATIAVARASGAAADARTTVTAFATPPTAAIAPTPNREPPLYQRLLAKLPFSGSDDAAATDQSASAGSDATALDPAAPLPPVRPASLSKDNSRRPNSPQASLGTGASLFSAHAIFASLPSFMKGAAQTLPTTTSGLAPLDH